MQIRIIVPLLYKLDKIFVTFLIGKKGKLKEPIFFIFYISIFIYQNIRIFAPFILSLPTSADAQAFKRWREKLQDSTLIYSRPLDYTYL